MLMTQHGNVRVGYVNASVGYTSQENVEEYKPRFAEGGEKNKILSTSYAQVI